MKWFFILIVVAAGVFWFISRKKSLSIAQRSPAKKKMPAHQSKNDKHPFHGISIKFDEKNACDAAKAIADKRFLSNEAPPLPLPDCDSSNCQCKYAHYDDRRFGDSDRRITSSLQSTLHKAAGQSERRERKGRRKADR